MGGNNRPRMVPYVLVPPLKGKKRASSPDSQGSSASLKKRGRRSPPVDRITRVSEDPSGACYELQDNELQESGNMVVFGETNPGEEEDEDNIPIRRLDDFTIYQIGSMKLIPACALLHLNISNGNFGASGLIQPWVDNNNDLESCGEASELDSDSESIDFDAYSDWDRVKLTKILEFDVHHVIKHSLDSKMYIRTEHAWYILGLPSTVYSPLFKSLWVNHRITHLFLTAAQQDAQMSLNDFPVLLSKLDNEIEGPTSAVAILGRTFSEGDFEQPDVQAYILQVASSDCPCDFSVARSALIRGLLNRYQSGGGDTSTGFPSTSKGSNDGYTSWSKDSLESGQGTKRLRRAKCLGQDLICITPGVRALSEGLFQVPMETVQALWDDSEEVDEHKVKDQVKHTSDIETVQWGCKVAHNVYHSAIIDGVCYKTGDIVIVPADSGYTGTNSSGRTTNKYGDNYWFCGIRYFFDGKDGAKMFHGQWFLHGSRTLIAELSHPGALYLIDSCEDLSIHCIYMKANVHFLKPGDPEPPMQDDAETNDFHCGLFYNETHGSYLNLPDAYLQPTSKPKHCSACTKIAETEAMGTPACTKPKDSFSYRGFTYHINDSVYVRSPDKQDMLLGVGQLVAFCGNGIDLLVTIRFFKRQVEFLPILDKDFLANAPDPDFFYDQHQLVFSDAPPKTINPDMLSGICYIKWLKKKEEIGLWVDHRDHFYLNQQEDKDGRLVPFPKRDFLPCKLCLQKREEQLRGEQSFLDTNKKLVAMELFSGAGGLGLGMELSQHVETKYAVEYFVPAALTFKKNHPETKIYCQDVNLLLKQAVEADSGKKILPVKSLHEGIPSRMMPSKHDGIDFILGGPPCQGFSRMNHERKNTDPRTAMPCNMLSYVEHYDPSYLLLENVEGMSDFELFDHRPGASGETIKWGMIKYILRVLIGLGYQCSYKKLQAAVYGVPQSRKRIIIWGAKRGLTAPKYPTPIFAPPKAKATASRSQFPNGNWSPPPSRALIPDADGFWHQCAPLPHISVFAAIMDLPAFEWGLPRHADRLYLPSADEDEEEGTRFWLGKPIIVLDACLEPGRAAEDDGAVGLWHGSLKNYACHPLTRFQQWLRKDMLPGDDGKAARVTGQYTRCFASSTVESTVRVPLKPNATHRDLPMVLRPNMAKPRQKQEKKNFYGRGDGNEHFRCALTEISPTVKNLWPLHPSQRRIFSVRELARAQGFPDNYEFLSDKKSRSWIIKDQIKQIGNAVAVPFAMAVGKELGAARIVDWKKQREESPEF